MDVSMDINECGVEELCVFKTIMKAELFMASLQYLAQRVVDGCARVCVCVCVGILFWHRDPLILSVW